MNLVLSEMWEYAINGLPSIAFFVELSRFRCHCHMPQYILQNINEYKSSVGSQLMQCERRIDAASRAFCRSALVCGNFLKHLLTLHYQGE